MHVNIATIHPSRLWQSSRARIILWAAFIGMALASPLGIAFEDFYYNFRAPLSLRAASGTIGLVEIDDRTLAEIGANDVPGRLDAKLIDTLFENGASKVFFDRVFGFNGIPSDDADFAAALERHRGKVFLGSLPEPGALTSNWVSLFPRAELRKHAQVVSLLGIVHPFGQSLDMPYSSNSSEGQVPSMSAKIAGIDEPRSGLFRPDYTIDHLTIPTLSYIDIINGKVPESAIKGRTFIVAPAATSFNDEHVLAGRAKVTGALFHAIAAETLLRGEPKNLGFMPLLFLVLAIATYGIRKGRVFNGSHASVILVAVTIVPFVLDRMGIQLAVVPAIGATIFIHLRYRSLNRVEKAADTNASSGLPSVQQLRHRSDRPSHALVALKIRNYGAIVGSFAQPVEAPLAAEILRRINITEGAAEVYHEGGMFLWLSSITDPRMLSESLEGLHSIVQRGINIDGRSIDLSFNCGVDTGWDQPLSLRAANSMQSAEEAARQDELVSIHAIKNEDAQWEISLLSELDRAIDVGEVWVAYQPKLDVKTGMIKGAEALVRWTHPERGSISPDKFIGIAEDHHRIERLTRYVLDEAVYAARLLTLDGFPMTISVNISAQLLRNPGLPEMIESVLVRHQLDPAQLILEITETDRLDRGAKTIEMLTDLVHMGVKLSIDDFGTGNATIDYLRYLPADEVKIDKAFVTNMDIERADFVLVQSIVEMAHSLGRSVVAEGVERREVFDLLSQLGCDMVQGYFVSKPLPFRNLIHLIARKSDRLIG